MDVAVNAAHNVQVIRCHIGEPVAHFLDVAFMLGERHVTFARLSIELERIDGQNTDPRFFACLVLRLACRILSIVKSVYVLDPIYGFFNHLLHPQFFRM